MYKIQSNFEMISVTGAYAFSIHQNTYLELHGTTMELFV